MNSFGWGHSPQEVETNATKLRIQYNAQSCAASELKACEGVHIPWSQTTLALIISSHIKKRVTKPRTPFCQDGVTGSVKTKQFIFSTEHFCGLKTETMLYNLKINSIHVANI